VEDEQVRFLSLRAGDLDMIERTPYSFVTKIHKGEFPELRATEAKYAGFRRLILNVSTPPFSNLKLRQAVRYALNKQEFLQGVFWGMGEPALVWGIPREHPWYVDIPEVKRDPARVKTLLKEAGVGPDFEIVIMARRGEEEENQILHRQLTSAGFKATLDFVEHAVHVRRQQQGEFMMTLSGSSSIADPGEEYPQRFGCKEAKNKVRIMNYPGYCNEEVDRLMAEAGKITDQKRRYELYAKAIRIIHEELPDLPIAFVPRFFTQQQKVRDFRTDFDGRFNLTTSGLSRTWLAK
jgi:peptide/nickel transport system substrate-binding protein